jgi:hypothetical protein
MMASSKRLSSSSDIIPLDINATDVFKEFAKRRQVSAHIDTVRRKPPGPSSVPEWQVKVWWDGRLRGVASDISSKVVARRAAVLDAMESLDFPTVELQDVIQTTLTGDGSPRRLRKAFDAAIGATPLSRLLRMQGALHAIVFSEPTM